MNTDIKSFEDLECWKQCTNLRRHLSQLIKDYPNHEKFLLVDQIKRASRSTTNNIAEGYGRYHHQENIQFCRQSRGSLYELLDHAIISLDEKYISKEEFEELRTMVNNALRVLNGYINYLKKAKDKS